MSQQTYQCEKCQNQIDGQTEDEAPQCCGQTMIIASPALDQCTISTTAEHSRMDDLDEPCDDGRAGT